MYVSQRKICNSTPEKCALLLLGIFALPVVWGKVNNKARRGIKNLLARAAISKGDCVFIIVRAGHRVDCRPLFWFKEENSKANKAT